MNFFKKTLLYLSIFAFTASILGIFFLLISKKDGFLRMNALFYVNKIKNFVYYEATIHNPEGDMLPDQIDDTIILEAKRILN